MTTVAPESPATLSPAQARDLFRHGLRTTTSGYASGFTQANMIALPRDWAFEMLLFAQRNPAPIPLLEVTDPGSTTTELAPGADLRTDFPRYRVWRDGQLVDEPGEVVKLWRPDLVTFLIGCSFSFEAALLAAHVPVRNIEQGRNVSMYRTNRACRPAGRLSGQLVVSMRPIPASLVPTAVRVTARMPGVHGAPVQVGAPEALGIRDLAAPDYGESVETAAADVPVFWACGVTPQAAVVAAKPPFAITHAPGYMLITDQPDARYVEP